MKTLFHLFYLCAAVLPLVINFGICFASYRWHLQMRAAIARELAELRNAR
jgi:hypothetical protein